jgi:hypothetical protein
LDQLVDSETQDKKGFFTKNKFMFVFENEGIVGGMICFNYKRGGR